VEGCVLTVRRAVRYLQQFPPVRRKGRAARQNWQNPRHRYTTLTTLHYTLPTEEAKQFLQKPPEPAGFFSRAEDSRSLGQNIATHLNWLLATC
jgi:hypothetical protein